MNSKLLTILFVFLYINVHSQDKDSTYNSAIKKGDTYLSLLLGYNGWKNNFAEIGIAKNQLNLVGSHPLGWTIFASTEIKLSNSQTVIGPKVGFWAGGGVSMVAMGLSTIYYTDFNKGTWRLRPEIGFGLDQFKLVYGYNLTLINKEFEKINKGNISLVILFRVKKLKTADK